MALNAEQIIENLERSIRLSMDLNSAYPVITYSKLRDTLALITSQEQRIRDLEVELKAMRGAANAYKMNIVELTEQRDGCELTIHECECDIKRLSEENERLNTSCTELTQCCTKLETLYKIECKRVDTVKADTVREMLQRIKEDAIAVSLLSNPPKFMIEIREDALDQIAKEMLEGNNERT